MSNVVRYVFALYVIFFSNLNAVSPLSKNLPPPYNEATLLPYNPHGWYNNHAPLEMLITRLQPKTVIEVGSWMGLSTMDIAQMLPAGGIVYAVDTWEGSPNETHDPTILESLYDQFLSNMIHSNLTHKVIPIRADSLQAASQLDILADLIYLDATHTYEACYADLQAWYPHLKQGGILCGDDLRWGDCGIERAVHQFAKEKSLIVHDNGWFWWLTSPQRTEERPHQKEKTRSHKIKNRM